MTKSATKRRGSAVFDPQRCVAFLTAVRPHKTAQAVSADSGIPAKTIERWLALDAGPSASALFTLLWTYGPAFGAAVMPGLDWMERAAALAAHEGMTREIERLTSKRASVAAQLGLDGDRA